MKFDEMGLAPEIMAAINDVGYTEPTPIQAQAIPVVMQGRDVLGIAQTGTGKTAGFTLPMIHRLMRGRAKARMPRTLILEPTRELAAQVAENFDLYGKNTRLSKALLIGGVSFGDQEKAIERGADVLIATPGRLLDHVERGKVLLRGVEVLVIDEADRMLDMGFIPDIERIVGLIPFTRQTLFFSATMPPEITRLSEKFLQAPERIEVARASSTNDKVSQAVITVKERQKRAALRALFEKEEIKNAIIFCNRKRDIGTLLDSLQRHKYDAVSLHGDMDQHTRLRMLDAFKNGNVTYLIASDVAARGLDIPEVSHVFNFDVPTHAEDYVHRIGRTGRGGRSGSAFTIATPSDAKYIEAIEKLIELDIPEIDSSEIDLPADEGGSKERSRRGDGKRERGTPRRRDGDASEPRAAEGSGRRRGLLGRRRNNAHASETPNTGQQDDSGASAPAAEKPKKTRPTKAAQSDEKPRKPARNKGDDRGSDVTGFGESMPAFMNIEPPK